VSRHGIGTVHTLGTLACDRKKFQLNNFLKMKKKKEKESKSKNKMNE